MSSIRIRKSQQGLAVNLSVNRRGTASRVSEAGTAHENVLQSVLDLPALYPNPALSEIVQGDYGTLSVYTGVPLWGVHWHYLNHSGKSDLPSLTDSPVINGTSDLGDWSIKVHVTVSTLVIPHRVYSVINTPPVTFYKESLAFEGGSNGDTGIDGQEPEDDEDDELTIVALDTTGTLGIATLDEFGSIWYDPDGQFAGLGSGNEVTDPYIYIVEDAVGLYNSGTITQRIKGI